MEQKGQNQGHWGSEGYALGTVDQGYHRHDTEVRKGGWRVDDVQPALPAT